MTICPECQHEIQIGEYPFCPHGAIYEQEARRFDPIVVWQANDNPSQFSFPGQASEAVPDGYHKIEIRNIREADKFVNRWNALERQKAEADRERHWSVIDEAVRQRRADTMARMGNNPKAQALFRAAREWADRRREQKRSQQSKDPRCHIQVLSFDSGNRPSYSGPETGWRERKS